jgi:hypothetical protein
VQEFKDHTCTNACIEEYYIPLETPKTKSKGGVDINNVKVEHVRNILELTKIVIERIIVETQKLSIRTRQEMQ